MPTKPDEFAKKRVLKKLKNGGADFSSIVAQYAGVSLGIASGAATASSIASAAGATTLCSSTLLASALGGIFITTTPVGWVVGSAAAAGIIGFGVARWAMSGGKEDQKRKYHMENLENRQRE